MIRVVPDTNVIISGMIIPHGNTTNIINLALARKIILYGSQETFNEFCKKIRKNKFFRYLKKQYFSPDKVIDDYCSFIFMINPLETPSNYNIVIDDPDDNKFIKVAIASKSRIIISGDKHLKKLKKHKNIIIVSPGRFIRSWIASNDNKLF